MDKRTKIFYTILILGSVLSTAFWTIYATSKYLSFNDIFLDIGIEAQNRFITLHSSSLVHGLQYIVSANHVTLDQTLFVLPLFYLYQSPVTLFFVQALVLSFTSLLIFFVAKELTKNDSFSFAIAIAYLLNPGMQGMLYFDFHAEFLIIPFAILTFYFYMKLKRKWFYLSLFLLLNTLDSVVFAVAAIGIGLLYYEFFYNKDKQIRKERIKLSISIIICAFVALGLYLAYYNILIPQYATSYNGLPSYLYVRPFDAFVLNHVFPGFISSKNPIYLNDITIPAKNEVPALNSASISAILFALLVGVFAFGIAVLADPILTVLLTAPWLAQVLFKNLSYGSIYLLYFSYVLSGSIIAAILGFIIIKEGKGSHTRLRLNKFNKVSENTIILSVLLLSLTAFIVALLVRPPIISSVQQACSAQINSMILQVPQNASLMTLTFISPHVADRSSLQLIEQNIYLEQINQSPVQKPKYILVDFNKCFTWFYNGHNYTQEYNSTLQYFDNYTRTNSYHIAAESGTAQLWIENQSS